MNAAATTRAFAIAWFMALVFYVLEYAARSAPAVMLPELGAAFARDGAGVGNILGSYYYAYSLTSLVAGLALDRHGARFVVAFGSFVLGVGCLLFVFDDAGIAYAGRLAQGAGSAFAFTGAVYLAARAFSARVLATAIGVTQSLGMLGGSAGQFVVGPMLRDGTPWHAVWWAFGLASIAVAVALAVVTPPSAPVAAVAPREPWWTPYAVVLRNPQSLLCGAVSGLLFAPTTLGAMTWGVAFLQTDRAFSYGDAVWLAAMVPLGWAIGCPLAGWISDRVGRRKPVLIAGAGLLAAAIAQLTYAPAAIPAAATLLVVGIASGVAMIPYSIIKEANPDRVKGSATGAINFMNFGVTALLGPVFAAAFGRTLPDAVDHVHHFQSAGAFWLAAVALAILLASTLRETGAHAAA